MNLQLASVAKAEAQKFYHGNVVGALTNLKPIANMFPYSETWTLDSWDNCWCAAFVYWCCIISGIELPVRYVSDAVSCNFAGCIAWEQWAKLPEINKWVERSCKPEIGDIVLFDYVFKNEEHDHIGIITAVYDDYIEISEGNFNNVSAVVKRSYDNIRGYVRF